MRLSRLEILFYKTMSKTTREYFLEGYNCAQSVMAAHSSQFGITEAEALKLALPMGGGVAGTRHICGALTAMMMLASLKHSDMTPSLENREKVYKLARKMAEDFALVHGSTICAQILQNAAIFAETFANPFDADKEYYKLKPCIRIIKTCEDIINNSLNNPDYYEDI